MGIGVNFRGIRYETGLISSLTSYNLPPFGLWRRPVARSLGVGEVGGSNPLSPTS
jgi:hypothetical protein